MTVTPYQGQVVPPLFRQRWLSGNHVGAAKPTCLVEFRRGRFVRRYHTGTEWTHTSITSGQDSLFGDVAGGNGKYWYPDWTPLSDWQEISEINDIQLQQAFDKNGLTSATIVIDNTILNPVTGVAGLFHQVQEGWWTPLRGYEDQAFPSPPISKNSNFQKLPNAQIRVWTGYGEDAKVVVFLGLIDSLDIEGGGSGGSQGAQVTINARDMGGVLQDEHAYMWNLDPMVEDPVTFVPRRIADKTVKVGGGKDGGGANASSEAPGHPARFVSDTNPRSSWQSKDNGGPNHTEWVQIKLPSTGSNEYSGTYVRPEFGGQDLYISIHHKVRWEQHGKQRKLIPCRWIPDNGQLNDVTVDQSKMKVTNYVRDPYSGLNYPEGWVDLYGQNVPGTDIPYFMVIRNTDAQKGRTINFGGSFLLGGGSTMRVSIRNLSKVQHRPARYRAGMIRLQGVRREEKRVARKAHWIIVDDIAEIVECCLRWSGFKTWEMEPTGVDLRTPYVAGKSKTFMDIINDIKQQTGYVFFMSEPRDPNNDNDLGYPVFRRSRVLTPLLQPSTDQITDDRLLTGSRINYTNQDERTIIRCRGQMLSKARGGKQLNGDRNYRAMFTYRPPWADRMSGVLKQLTHYDVAYLSEDDCQIGCYLIALQIALADITAITPTAATPAIGLDSMYRIIDKSSGTATRIYCTNRTMQFTAGEQVKFISTLGGAVIDNPDVVTIVRQYQDAVKSMDPNDGPAASFPPTRRDEHKHVKALTVAT